MLAQGISEPGSANHSDRFERSEFRGYGWPGVAGEDGTGRVPASRQWFDGELEQVIDRRREPEEPRPPGGWSEPGADPLYLFACGLRWQRHREVEAGWELLSSARFGEEGEREVALELLAGVETRQLVRIRSWIGGVNPAVGEAAGPGIFGEGGKEEGMNTPYGLEIVESCFSCQLKREQSFCNLTGPVLKVFSGISHQTTFPGGATLFVEGQTPRGVFLLCSGKVKLSTTSRDGKVLILKMAGAGDVLGLSAVIAGSSYEVTAETAMPCQVNFVQREALVSLLQRFGEAGLRSAQTLSREFQSAYRDIHDLILARSSAGKLAKLLLSWTPPTTENSAKEIRVRYGLTHEEMAQMIGASRETVTRLLSELRKKQLIRLEGSTLVIRNRTALEALVS